MENDMSIINDKLLMEKEKLTINNSQLNIKKGYKQTEIGIIPENWDVVKLEDIGKNIIGLTYSPNNVKSFGHLVLRSSNIQNSKLAFENNVFVEMELPDRVIVKENDILICVRNGSKHLIGKCALIDKRTEGCAFGAFMSVYRTKYAKFIFHQFQSNIIQRQIDEVMGATINQLTNKDLSTFKIPMPKVVAEQTAIATALSDTDALINSLEKLIAKKRNIKQGAMQQLLKPKEGDALSLSKGWEVKKLGEIATFFSGGTPNTSIPSYYHGEICWITSGDLNKNVIYEVEGRISEDGLNNSSAKMIKENTLLIALYGATAGVTAISKIKAAINQAVLAIMLNANFSIDFLYYQLTYRKEWIILTYTQGGQPNLSGNIIKSIEMLFPTFEEQTRIATILSDMDNEIQTLETKLEKYKKVKLGMMQNLLTGKVRLL